MEALRLIAMEHYVFSKESAIVRIVRSIEESKNGDHLTLQPAASAKKQNLVNLYWMFAQGVWRSSNCVYPPTFG